MVKALSLNNINKRIVMGPWPATRKKATQLGVKDFYTSTPCRNGHLTIRRTSSGKCYECERTSWEKVRRRKGKKPFIPNAAKQLAEKLDEKFYKGMPCPHGHSGLRWTYNGACVECSNSAAREYHRRSDGIIYLQKWREDNPDKVRNYNRNSKARRKGADGVHSAQDIRDILKRQKFRCVECGTSVRKKDNRHVDHIMPLALGGTNWPHNLQVLCPACNLSKNAKHPLEWAKLKGR